MKILFFLLLFMLPGAAHIGETLDQSCQRYGQPQWTKETASDCLEAVFLKNGFWVDAEFYKGVCVGLNFSKYSPATSALDPATGKQAEDFTLDEIDLILKQNGSEWVTKGLNAENTQCTWRGTSDITAIWLFESRSLLISGPNWYLYDEATVEKGRADQVTAAARSTQGL